MSGPQVVVVGGGISGAACARELQAGGVPVRVLDRGRKPGGRMASRRLWDRPVDLGASYFTASDGGFAAVVADWEARGLARRWTDTFLALGDGDPEKKTGPMRYGAQHGLRSLVEDLLDGLDLTEAAVGSVDELAADAIVLAMPDAQARRLLPHDHPLTGRLDRESEPVMALAARYDERTWYLDGAFVNGDAALAWIADDGRRRGDDAPVLVAHSTPDLAAQHLEDPSGAVPAMVEALRRTLDLPEPQDTYVHRWSLARPTGDRDEPYALHDAEADAGNQIIGVCGDGWGATSKVETAWRSGTDLGRALVERLG